MQYNRESFLKLVRLGIGHNALSIPQITNWQEIQALADQQGLFAVVFDGVMKLPDDKRPPRPFYLEWIGGLMLDYESRYEMYMHAISELAGFYQAHGFKMMVLKGYACSLSWPKPNHRPCGDIDIWQFGKQKEADDVLAKEKGVEIDSSHHHHTVFNWGEFTVENHYDFLNVHHHKTNSDIEKLLKELGQDDSHSVEVYGNKIYFPSPNLHALFLICHALSHFATVKMSLRQVLDWAFFVEKHTKEVDWIWLNRILEDTHMKVFFNTINAICVEDLGFDIHIFPQVQFDPNIKERVLNDIISPEFNEKTPDSFLPRIVFKIRRWNANKWKHVLCYKESRWSIFWSGIWNHILKPASI